MGETLRNLQGGAERRCEKVRHRRSPRARAGRLADLQVIPRTEARVLRRHSAHVDLPLPVDKRLRQIRLGRWPAIGWEKAVARWDGLRRARDDGLDPQLDCRSGGPTT